MNMEQAIEKYLTHIKDSYKNWGERSEIRDQMIVEFNDALKVVKGRKYTKIVSGGGVHSFIVNKTEGKFREGDILKAASWAAPATNFARGNVFDGNFMNITWTGA